MKRLGMQHIQEKLAIDRYVNEEGPRLRNQIAAYEQQVIALNQNIISLQSQVAQNNSIISSQSLQLSHKDKIIQDNLHKLSQKQTEIDKSHHAYAQSIATKDQEIQELSKIIALNEDTPIVVAGIPIALSSNIATQTEAIVDMSGDDSDYTMVEV